MTDQTVRLLRPSKIAILLLLVSFATISALLFTPSLPQLAIDFGISESTAQWSMTIFLIGYTIGQLPYGPIANRFGRKKAIYLGICIALIGMGISLFAPSFWILCIGRFIQALGSAVGLKVSFTMIGDQHAGSSATKALSILTMAFGIMPGIGMAIGGWIAVLYGWKGCFVFLSIYSVFLGLLCATLPETAKELDKDALQVKKIAHGYMRQFKNPFTMQHACLVGLSTSMFYIFASVAPYIGIDGIGLTPAQYGLWTLVPMSGLVLGTLTAHSLAARAPRSNMLSAILIILIGLIAMAFCFVNSWVHPFSLFGTMFLMQIGMNLLWINASSKGISEAADKSNASAVIQFTNVGLATLGTLAASLFTPVPMLLPALFSAIFILMLIVWLRLKNIRTT